MRSYSKILLAVVSTALFSSGLFAASPIDSLNEETKAQLRSCAEELASSFSLFVPEHWNENTYEAAYLAYCEGWGVKKDVSKGLELLQKGSDKGFVLPTVLLADVRLNGYHDTQENFEAALKLYSKAYNATSDDLTRARISLKITDAYLNHSDSVFASYYAIPWIRLYLINGGTEEDVDRMADLLLQCEEEAHVYDAGELIGEFKDGMLDYHKSYNGRTIMVRGRIADVSKGSFSGKYTVKLFPAGDIRSLLPSFLSGFAKLTEEDNSTVSSLLKKGSKAASLWNEYRNTVECVLNGSEAEALQTAEIVIIRGTYALGTSLLPKLKDCELYLEPPIQAPEVDAPAEERQESPQDKSSRTIQI